MASFLIKVSLFVGLLLALLAALVGFSIKTYFENKNVYAKKTILLQKAPTCRNYLLVLGNSHAQFAINTPLITQNGINMASPSQSMMEDFAILKMAHSLNPGISNVMLTYSFHSNSNFLYESNRNEEVNRMFEYAHAYNIQYPKHAYTTKKYLGLLSNWAVYITKRPNSRNDLDALGNLNDLCKSHNYTITNVNQRVDQHFDEQTQIGSPQNPYFDSIRNFCQKYRLPFLVIIPPYTRAYINRIKEKQPEAFAFINQLSNLANRSFTLIDCRNILENNEALYFKDADHLSACGRDEFSNYLKGKMP